ncbi:YbjN domain-containing protein [Alphaproteobacteria bacterium]|nr:YbjN domain-containing protein [Alphaproteobacteria bacterium]
MTQIKIEDIKTLHDPIDLIEEVVLANGWEYERDDNKNIHVQVGGNWCEYQLSYGLNERGNIIYLSCALDIKVTDKNSTEIYKLLSNINQKLSLGHFEVWIEDGWPIFRHSILITDAKSFCKSQIEQVSLIALEECERFYPAFQFLLWDNKNANDSLNSLMLYTLGEA